MLTDRWETPPISAASLERQYAPSHRRASTSMAAVGSGLWWQNGQRRSTLEAATKALVVACPGGRVHGKTAEMPQPGKQRYSDRSEWRSRVQSPTRHNNGSLRRLVFPAQKNYFTQLVGWQINAVTVCNDCHFNRVKKLTEDAIIILITTLGAKVLLLHLKKHRTVPSSMLLLFTPTNTV